MSDPLNTEQPEVGNESGHEINVMENLHLDLRFMPEILKEVFKQLGRNELKECRSVCKAWNTATIPFTRDAFVVTIYGNRNPQEKLHTIENFVDTFRSNQFGIPFARFKLGSFCTTERIGQEFLQICGKAIQDINFLDGDDFKVEDVSEILKSTQKLETFRMPRTLQSTTGNIVKLFPEDSKKPRLTSLKKFDYSYDNPKERNEFCPTFLEELITAAPNISCLNLQDTRDLDGGIDCNFSSFDVMSLIEKLGREPSIQQISISPHSRNHTDCAELLLKMARKRNEFGLKLNTLSYYTHYSNEDTQPIFQALPFFKNTLQLLKINGTNFTMFMELPEMARLTSLFVTLSEELNTRFINLIKILPVLESLHLICMAHPYIQYDEFLPESNPCPTMKILDLSGFYLKINGFTQMLEVFPNLTKLKMSIKDDGEEILRQIWTQMTQVESLHIFGYIQVTESMDCVLTGIPDHVLHEIRDVVNNLDKMESDVERANKILELRNQHCQFPTIGNLKNLKSLSLCLTDNEEENCDRTYLTDITGYLAFYSIQSLKEIYIGEACEMTKTCCETLVKDMGLETWTFWTHEYGKIWSG